ncbi:MAG: Smr/MutS family protein [Alphaproteobacteria bacterium]|nr:Smr/MutS family protein [Alphaproteobacteria bacterium]
MKNYLKDVKPLTAVHTTITQKKINVNKKLITERSEQILISKESTLTSMSRKQKRKFEYGKTIDLHGYTREEAFMALARFFNSCQREGTRKVLVITGGNNMRETTLRKHFQIWVREKFGNYVTSCASANIRHGGQGAFYLILKKGRSCL